MNLLNVLKVLIVLGKLIRDNQQFKSHDTRPEQSSLALLPHFPLATCHFCLGKRRVKLKTMPAIK